MIYLTVPLFLDVPAPNLADKIPGSETTIARMETLKFAEPLTSKLSRCGDRDALISFILSRTFRRNRPTNSSVRGVSRLDVACTLPSSKISGLFERIRYRKQGAANRVPSRCLNTYGPKYLMHAGEVCYKREEGPLCPIGK